MSRRTYGPAIDSNTEKEKAQLEKDLADGTLTPVSNGMNPHAISHIGSAKPQPEEKKPVSLADIDILGENKTDSDDMQKEVKRPNMIRAFLIAQEEGRRNREAREARESKQAEGPDI